MSMANKLTLRKQILLGYLAPLALLLGLSASVYWSVQSLHQIRDSVDTAQSIVSNVREVHLRLSESFRAVQEYLLFKNEISHNNYQTAAAEFLDKLQTVGEQVKDPEQQANLNKINTVGKRLLDFMQKQTGLVKAGQSAKAVETFRAGDSVDLLRELNSLVVAFERRETEILSARKQTEGNASSQLVGIVGGATALAVILAVLLGLWIASRIGKSIGEAVAGMSTSSTEIAATVDEHERTVTQQAAAVSQTTSTVEELRISASQTAGQAESSTAAAKHAFELSQKGIALVDQAAQGMAGMKHKVGSVAEQILRLSEQAGQIGSIAKVVGELAGETNMLALNAAVEAARAGEQGKGFAVVAAEVRKLADQSKKSAERTDALVVDIQKATNLAVMATEEGSVTADEVAALTQKVVDAFNSIASAVNNVSENTQQTLLNAKQQAGALSQVSEAMKSLSTGSRQMAAGTEQTKAGVQRLNSVAKDLEAMV
jgi:methyl-accepting chemotaxis protein